MFEKIAVIGVGLLGGSLCRCLKERTANIRITGVSPVRADLSLPIAEGVVDIACSLKELSLADLDLVVIATPVAVSLSILEHLLERTDLNDNLIITDVGSVKAPLTETALKHARADRFIGSHPMAGSEKSGYPDSTADLYRKASVIITPTSANRQDDVDRLIELWHMAGSHVVIADSSTHDAIVAFTSHLPHMAACAVVNALEKLRAGDAFSENIMPFIGRGFRDVTRISSGSPEIWGDIINLNKNNLVDSLHAVIDALSTLLDAVERESGPDVMDFLNRAKSARDKIK